MNVLVENCIQNENFRIYLSHVIKSIVNYMIFIFFIKMIFWGAHSVVRCNREESCESISFGH